MRFIWARTELAAGDNQPKSATKPMKIQPLDGLKIYECASSSSTSCLLSL